MKKQLNKALSIILTTCVIMVSAVPAFALELRQEPTGYIPETGEYELFATNKAFTVSDLNNDFDNYVDDEAIIYLPNTFSNENVTRVVGIVLDYDNDAAIAGATILMDGEAITVTDENGKFQIENVSDGEYVWEIRANDYCEARYLNYVIHHQEGTNIFTFYIDKDTAIEKNRNDIAGICQEVPAELDSLSTSSFQRQTASLALDAVPTVDATVAVLYNGRTQHIDRETYLAGVLAIEAYNESYYVGKGLTEYQVWQYYCAQAIATNTYVEYSKNKYSEHSGEDYYLCSNPGCCHAYDPSQVTEAELDAVADIHFTVGGQPTSCVLFYEPTSGTYHYFWAAYFSDCDNQGTRTNSVEGALQAKSCTDLTNGANGHRYGFCQMGAANMAKQGEAAGSILEYYYTDCDIEFCVIE